MGLARARQSSLTSPGLMRPDFPPLWRAFASPPSAQPNNAPPHLPEVPQMTHVRGQCRSRECGAVRIVLFVYVRYCDWTNMLKPQRRSGRRAGQPFFLAARPEPPGSDKALRHEVVSVIVVRDRTSRHNPLSHQRYPTKMCRKATICTASSDNVPTVTRLASKP